MICRSLSACLIVLAYSIACAESGYMAIVQRLKAERTVAGMSELLRDLGIPKDSINRLSFIYAPPDSEGGMEVHRAETFEEDLDGDGQKEWVSQVIFQTPPSYGKSAIEYIFMIHSQSDSRPRLLFHRTFRLMKCGYVKASGMRFSFVKPKKGGSKTIHFKITDVSTCDVGGQTFKVGTDTLQIRSAGWTYLRDEWPKEIDRVGDPEGP